MKTYLLPIAVAIACYLLPVGLTGCDTNRGGDLLAPLMFGDEEADRQGEPNDSIAEATDLPPEGESASYSLHLSSDTDYYRINADSNVVYEILTRVAERADDGEEADESLKIRLEIVDSGDNSLVVGIAAAIPPLDKSWYAPALGYSYAPEVRYLSWRAPASGVFYARVGSTDNETGGYNLVWSSLSDSAPAKLR
jgi:hypothetical protein